jgi:hypothetical protein
MVRIGMAEFDFFDAKFDDQSQFFNGNLDIKTLNCVFELMILGKIGSFYEK